MKMKDKKLLRKNMKRILCLLLCAVLFAGILSGCGSKQGDNMRFAYITDVSGLDSATSMAVTGAFSDILEYYTFEYDVFTPKDEADCQKFVNSVYADNYNLVIGTSYFVNAKLIEKSKEVPERCVAVIGTPDSSGNTLSIDFKMEEASFLAGLLAAASSKTGVVGYVGSSSSELAEYEVGFYAGARTYNPDIKVYSRYTNSYNNVTKGYDLSIELIDSGADVIYSNCGATSLGVGKAVSERDAKVIHSDLYAMQDAPYILGATKKNIKKAALYITDNYINGDFRPGMNRFGIVYDMVDMDMTAQVPEEIKEMIANYRVEIRQNDIKIPANWKDYETFVYPEINKN